MLPQLSIWANYVFIWYGHWLRRRDTADASNRKVDKNGPNKPQPFYHKKNYSMTNNANYLAWKKEWHLAGRSSIAPHRQLFGHTTQQQRQPEKRPIVATLNSVNGTVFQFRRNLSSSVKTYHLVSLCMRSDAHKLHHPKKKSETSNETATWECKIRGKKTVHPIGYDQSSFNL